MYFKHVCVCFTYVYIYIWISLVAQMVKHLPTVRETWVRSLGQEDPLEKEMATHSSTLAWKIPWTEERSRLQSMGSQRVGHDWATSLHIYIYICLLSHVHLFLNPMDCSLSGSSVHRILQARILEWVAIPFSRESSQPRDWTWVSYITGRFFTIWATRETTPPKKKIYKYIYTHAKSWTWLGDWTTTHIHTCEIKFRKGISETLLLLEREMKLWHKVMWRKRSLFSLYTYMFKFFAQRMYSCITYIFCK